MIDMLLCIIPKINPDAPTVGPAVLKATLQKAGYSCTVLDLNIDLIIVLTDTGKIARHVAKYRPPVTILACSISLPVVRQLNTSRGVIGYKIPSF